MFSVVNAVLLQPLSYPQPDRLVALMRSSRVGNQWAISVPKFIVYREQTKIFESTTAYDFAGPGINLTGGDRPEQVKGIHASAGYFDVFGAPVALEDACWHRLMPLSLGRMEGDHLVCRYHGLAFDASPDEKDTVSDVAGIPLAVDPLSQPYADGAIIDFVEGPEGTGFLVKNPTLGGGCACGGGG